MHVEEDAAAGLAVVCVDKQFNRIMNDLTRRSPSNEQNLDYQGPCYSPDCAWGLLWKLWLAWTRTMLRIMPAKYKYWTTACQCSRICCGLF